MAILELCAGYGGLAVAVEWLTGDTTTHVAEVHPAACKVMAQRFPDAPNLGDARKIKWQELAGIITTISCGFPCQDISDAGTREGIKGERSGLWFSVADAIRIIRPAHVFLENVSAIRNRGQAAVLTSLHEIGYDARWTTLRASDIGAPHQRERWLAAAVFDPFRRRVRHRRSFSWYPIIGGLEARWVQSGSGHDYKVVREVRKAQQS